MLGRLMPDFKDTGLTPQFFAISHDDDKSPLQLYLNLIKKNFLYQCASEAYGLELDVKMQDVKALVKKYQNTFGLNIKNNAPENPIINYQVEKRFLELAKQKFTTTNVLDELCRIAFDEEELEDVEREDDYRSSPTSETSDDSDDEDSVEISANFDPLLKQLNRLGEDKNFSGITKSSDGIKHSQLAVSVLHRVANAGLINLDKVKAVQLGNEGMAYALPDGPVHFTYVINSDGQRQSLYEVVDKSPTLILDNVINTTQQLYEILSIIGQDDKDKSVAAIDSSFSKEHVAQLIKTKSALKILLQGLPPGADPKNLRGLILQKELLLDSLLTDNFFKPALRPELKVSFPLPTTVESLPQFLATGDNPKIPKSKDGEKFRQGVIDLVSQLRQWPEKHGLNMDVSNLDALINKINNYSGSDKEMNVIKFPLYKEGALFIAGIIEKLNEPSRGETTITRADLDKRATILTNLMPGFLVCEPGIFTNLTNAYTELSADPAVIMESIRRKLAEQVTLEAIADARIVDEYNRGNEIHYVNSVLNYYAEDLGINAIEDSYADSMEHNSELSNLATTTIKAKLENILTMDNIIDYIVKTNLQEVSAKVKEVTFDNFTKQLKVIEGQMSYYGDDSLQRDFHLLNAEQLNEGTIQPESDEHINNYLAASITERFKASGFIQQEKISEINLSNQVSIYIPGGNFKLAYAIDRSNATGVAEERLPLTIYLENAAANLVSELYLAIPELQEDTKKLLNFLEIMTDNAKEIIFEKHVSDLEKRMIDSPESVAEYLNILTEKARIRYYWQDNLMNHITNYQKTHPKIVSPLGFLNGIYAELKPALRNDFYDNFSSYINRFSATAPKLIELFQLNLNPDFLGKMITEAIKAHSFEDMKEFWKVAGHLLSAGMIGGLDNLLKNVDARYIQQVVEVSTSAIPFNVNTALHIYHLLDNDYLNKIESGKDLSDFLNKFSGKAKIAVFAEMDVDLLHKVLNTPEAIQSLIMDMGVNGNCGIILEKLGAEHLTNVFPSVADAIDTLWLGNLTDNNQIFKFFADRIFVDMPASEDIDFFIAKAQNQNLTSDFGGDFLRLHNKFKVEKSNALINIHLQAMVDTFKLMDPNSPKMEELRSKVVTEIPSLTLSQLQTEFEKELKHTCGSVVGGKIDPQQAIYLMNNNTTESNANNEPLKYNTLRILSLALAGICKDYKTSRSKFEPLVSQVLKPDAYNAEPAKETDQEEIRRAKLS